MFGWILCALERPAHQPDIGEVYLKYKRLMYATASQFTQNAEDQKDIVQTALERLIKIFSAPGVKKRCISASYIVFTIRSVSIDFLRRQSREAERRVDMDEKQLAGLAATEGTPDVLLLASDCARQMWDRWNDLPAEGRILLEGKYILDLSDEELAGILKCKTASVRMKLTRARRRATKLLSERNEL